MNALLLCANLSTIITQIFITILRIMNFLLIVQGSTQKKPSVLCFSLTKKNPIKKADAKQKSPILANFPSFRNLFSPQKKTTKTDRILLPPPRICVILKIMIFSFFAGSCRKKKAKTDGTHNQQKNISMIKNSSLIANRIFQITL